MAKKRPNRPDVTRRNLTPLKRELNECVGAIQALETRVKDIEAKLAALIHGGVEEVAQVTHDANDH